MPPHSEIDCLFASRQVLIYFSQNPLTAKSIFYLPHGECRFYFSYPPSRQNRSSIRLMANVDFLFASRRMSILFFLRPLKAKLILYSPHGGCSHSLPLRQGTSTFARARPFADIALSAGPLSFCSRMAIRCHCAERWGIPILLVCGHLLPLC